MKKKKKRKLPEQLSRKQSEAVMSAESAQLMSVKKGLKIITDCCSRVQ